MDYMDPVTKDQETLRPPEPMHREALTKEEIGAWESKRREHAGTIRGRFAEGLRRRLTILDFRSYGFVPDEPRNRDRCRQPT
jgi:hypothetical protein